uniref:3-oxo-5-alpha-steroid 4-dehydrogenase 3 n=1 Tax=Tetraselmis sp. GSL018 TaxID=582737 RepID=A0A061SJL0_9CHLO
MLLLHLCRRAAESSLLSRFGSGARMHAAGYGVGLSYYAALPPTILPASASPGRACWASTRLFSDGSGGWSFLRRAIGVLLFAAGSWKQFEAHRILASLRTSRPANDHGGYGLPRGGWFELVSCPHYLAEIVLYIGIVLFQGVSAGAFLMLLWVVVNLSFTAMATHTWYRKNFIDYPRERRAIIPGIL